MRVSGRVIAGFGAWRPRMERFPEVFLQGTGTRLFPGTLNVQLDESLPIRAEFSELRPLIVNPDSVVVELPNRSG